jgi:hypothetical protein
MHLLIVLYPCAMVLATPPKRAAASPAAEGAFPNASSLLAALIMKARKMAKDRGKTKSSVLNGWHCQTSDGRSCHMDRTLLQAMTPSIISSGHGPSFDAQIQLGPDLWFDEATATLRRSGESILLTAREASLLLALLTAPGRFHSASTLARLLKRRQPYPITPHSIEQTICGLRKKLGENGQTSTLLRTRRGLGYGLFLPTSTKPPRSL